MQSQEPDKNSPMKDRSRRFGPVVAAAAVLIAVLAVGLFAVIANRPCPLAAERVAPAALTPTPGVQVTASQSASSSLTPLSASTEAPRTDAPEDASMAAEAQSKLKAARQAVKKLVEEQKFEAAAEETARFREEAKKAGDNPLWTWALIKEGQLRTALHGYETAVRFFKEQAWPDSPLERDMLDLFYAQSLVTYYRVYSWDIDRRERVEAKGPIDLKSWTRDQIFDEAWKSALRVWKDRERLAGRKAAEFPDFWTPGSYPAGVRDTLRDGVVYLMARLLADTGFWTPRQSNETWLLDLDKLLAQAGKAGSGDSAAERILESAASHPIEKVCALLGEHESFSRRASRPEAALEARFELVQALYAAFDSDESHAAIRAHLAEFLPSQRKHAWWAVGQALLAEYTRQEAAPDALVRARKLAAEGVERFPSSPGGLHCRHILKSIEAPEYSIESMRTDAPGRRSVRISHRNLDRVFLRAYAIDLEALVKTARDYYIFPQGDAARKIVEGRRPEAVWETELPRTSDFREHRTYTNLPQSLAPGLYLIAASAREDFAAVGNRTIGLSVILGDLVMIKRDGGGRTRVRNADIDGGKEILVISGTTGRPLSEVTVDLYAFDWKKGHAKIESKTTDAQGRVWFAPREPSGPYFLLAKKGRDIAFDPDYLYLYGGSEPRESRAALIYTDRSIYRPGQKIFWKILAYKGRADLGKLSPDAGTGVSVWLEDINNQRVASTTATTNAFGTASGEFTVPAAGRPLGGWRLRSSPDGQAAVRVEEYKRPTFEVSVKDPAKPLRLNRPAALKGEARYYFGLPVTGGEAVWQVRRQPVYPRWWWWETGGGRSQPVAGGRAKIGADGVFDVEFTPRADENKDGAASGLSYRYTLSVDVTDEGGETRSASRSFRLGFVSVEARLEAASEFVRADAKSVFTVTRGDLNGTPKAGKGAWRVLRLIQPEATLLPADQPILEPPGTKDPMFPPTPGDRLRARWDSCSPDTILRLWQEGSDAAKGAADHDAKGMATVAVPALGPGAYRLLYETKDDFGAVCRDSLDFLVVGGGGAKPALKLPLVLRAEKSSVPVGGTARLFVDCGWNGQPVLLETFRGGELWERRWIEAGKDGGVIDMPVTEDLSGGFGALVTAVRDHQFMSEEASVFVPWDNKELGISFSTFRDKLTPGGRETWRVTVKTPAGKPAVQGAAELLAYMYDRSLDLFAPHRPPRLLGLYPGRTGTAWWDAALGTAPMSFAFDYDWNRVPSYPTFNPDELFALGGYGIGGPGGRSYGGVVGSVVGGVLGGVVAESARPSPQMAKSASMNDRASAKEEKDKEGAPPPQEAGIVGQEAQPQLRSNFAETAFWQPHLLTGADGTATIEFTVPDSVTGWRVFVHGVTRDLMGGTLETEARTVKDLMVRPYLPRFFREGDKAELRVMVNNAGQAALAGDVSLEIYDPLTNENLAPAFGLPAIVPVRAFSVAAGGWTAVVFPLLAPARVGTVA
ncbi:MAG: MG2 domain-containing protein, partial [Candidatus Aminicenantes bacterium]|nr:MG2 domain-containing protein [Candidatus Aminicenantes bacterium]